MNGINNITGKQANNKESSANLQANEREGEKREEEREVD